MNYFEHHIGDYAEATSHLSFVEDAAYSRCIRKYYAKEKPLPADVAAVQRLIGARSKVEKDAVEKVLAEFFVLDQDGWRNARCDADIAAFQAGEPERETKKRNEETRLKRHREERAALFEALHLAGEHAPWNIRIDDLRKLAAAVAERGTGNGLPPLPATAPATPATATQTPIPNTHTQNINTMSAKPADEEMDDQQDNAGKLADPVTSKYIPEDEACARWLFDRILKTNPGHKPPKIASWADDVRLMRVRDKRNHREICELFSWAQDDKFWRSNILSPAKLREQWDQLIIKRGTPQKGAVHGNFGSQDYRAGVGDDGKF